MIVEARTATTTTTTEKAPLPSLEETRCRQCARLLCKNTREALRPGQLIEIKCASCNVMNFLVGRPSDLY